MLKYLLPLLGFGLLALLLAIGLRLNPREIPSPLLGKPVPTFSLPILQQTEQRFGPEQMQGQVWLLNVWASWCVSCREEHGTLLQWVASSPIKLIGLNYKDQAEQAAQWLNSLGNPY